MLPRRSPKKMPRILTPSSFLIPWVKQLFLEEAWSASLKAICSMSQNGQCFQHSTSVTLKRKFNIASRISWMILTEWNPIAINRILIGTRFRKAAKTRINLMPMQTYKKCTWPNKRQSNSKRMNLGESRGTRNFKWEKCQLNSRINNSRLMHTREIKRILKINDSSKKNK